jgi:hypothetical protein
MVLQARSCYFFLLVSGYPKPKYQWLKDGIALGEFSSEHFYRIHTIQRGDAGSYQCIARNDVGSIFSEKIAVSVACMYSINITLFGTSQEMLSAYFGNVLTLYVYWYAS